MNDHFSSNNRVGWFVKWIDSRDPSMFRNDSLVVNLLCGHGRLDRMKNLAFDIVRVCEERNITVLFYVTDPGAMPRHDTHLPIMEQDNCIIHYTLREYYGNIGRINRNLSLNHKVILRRMYLQNAEIIDNIGKVDLIIIDYLPESVHFESFQAFFNQKVSIDWNNYDDFYQNVSKSLHQDGLLINFMISGLWDGDLSSPEKLFDTFHQVHPITKIKDQLQSFGEHTVSTYYDVWLPKVI